MEETASEALFRRANAVIPGGVNSPVRAFKAVGGIPPFIASARGCTITDTSGRVYIDYVGSYGPLLFGHAPAFITEAIARAAERGTTFGAPTELEVEMAELVTEMVPSMEMVRFVNSGSEATTSAIRLARGATGRSKIIKCTGCYHGSVDALLASAGSGIATLGIPETAGVPASLAAETIVVDYNDIEALRTAFEKFPGQIAALILEPIAANMGVVPPFPSYLESARALTSEHGALLIFDEVITGFRVAPGGAQELYGVHPDLTCLGKIVGGGVPCGAYGGRSEIMKMLAPIGPVYQAGTLSGNPLAMSAGLEMLREIGRRGTALYAQLDERGAELAAGIVKVCRAADLPVQVQRVGSLLTPFFTSEAVTDYARAKACDTGFFARLFHELLAEGIYIAPSQFEALFVSDAHTSADIVRTVSGFELAVARAMQPAGI